MTIQPLQTLIPPREYVLVIPGKPLAKHRPRFTVLKDKAGKVKGTRTFSDQESEESKVMWHITNQWRAAALAGALTVTMGFIFAPNATDTKRVRADKLAGLIRHTKKPDTDNLKKFYLDAMRGIVFRDDAQVDSGGALKWFGEVPQTIIVVTEGQFPEIPPALRRNLAFLAS
jgi:Holliday junction resolvase RusA-like endonuclease